MKQKIIVYLKNRNDPSSFYRLYQYLNQSDCRIVEESSSLIYMWYYNGNGKFLTIKRILMAVENVVRVTYFILRDMVFINSDTIIINRKLFARKMPIYGRWLLNKYLTGKKVYWDFDDNIRKDGEITESEFALLQFYSKKIVVTNQYLKETLPKLLWNKVDILPTTDMSFLYADIDTWNKRRNQNYKTQIDLIWVGTKNNLCYLESMISELDLAAIECERFGKKLILTIICNKQLIRKTNSLKVNNINWSRLTTIEQLAKAHIGLMPLDDNEYSRGKGGFKAIQYIAAGVPAVVSNVGYNSNVISCGCNGILVEDKSKWGEAVLELCTNGNKWNNYSKEARRVWETKFNPDRQVQYWGKIINRGTLECD